MLHRAQWLQSGVPFPKEWPARALRFKRLRARGEIRAPDPRRVFPIPYSVRVPNRGNWAVWRNPPASRTASWRYIRILSGRCSARRDLCANAIRILPKRGLKEREHVRLRPKWYFSEVLVSDKTSLQKAIPANPKRSVSVYIGNPPRHSRAVVTASSAWGATGAAGAMELGRISDILRTHSGAVPVGDGEGVQLRHQVAVSGAGKDLRAAPKRRWGIRAGRRGNGERRWRRMHIGRAYGGL